MKTINFELSKRLSDLGLLDNIETEYCYWEQSMGEDKGKIVVCYYYVIKGGKLEYKAIKTLILEELGEFLKNQKFGYGINITTYFNNISGFWETCYTNEDFEIQDLGMGLGKTQIESMEELLKHLLDNNLLTK